MNTDHPGWSRAGWLLVLLALAGVGCRSAAPKQPDPLPPVPGTGYVVRVNEAERLVVVHAAVLPEAGQEATVSGRDGEAGRIRFTSVLSPPYMAAEILEGRPRRGDQFQVEQKAAEHRSTP